MDGDIHRFPLPDMATRSGRERWAKLRIAGEDAPGGKAQISLQKVQFAGARHGLGAAARIQFAIDVFEVYFDCAD